MAQVGTEAKPMVQDKGDAPSWRKRVASSGGGITFFHSLVAHLRQRLARLAQR